MYLCINIYSILFSKLSIYSFIYLLINLSLFTLLSYTNLNSILFLINFAKSEQQIRVPVYVYCFHKTNSYRIDRIRNVCFPTDFCLIVTHKSLNKYLIVHKCKHPTKYFNLKYSVIYENWLTFSITQLLMFS